MAGKKTGKRLLTWVLVLVMALSLLPLNVLAANSGSGMNFDKQLVDDKPDGDGNYTIQITAQATGTTTTTTTVKPMDIVLVLDQSGSMADDFGNGTRQSAMKAAVNSFIDEVAKKHGPNADHRMAIVTFGTNAYPLVGWTAVDNSGKNTLTDAIDSPTMTPSGATNVGAGMELAQTLMGRNYNYTGGNTDRLKTVIVFTDGVPTKQRDFNTEVANTAISAAKAMKDDDVTIYTVGIFNGANPTEMYGASGFDTNSDGTVNSEWAEDNWGLFPSTDFPKADRPAGNRFLNLVSSNYPNADSIGLKRETSGLGILHSGISYKITKNFNRVAEGDYYLTASDASSLKNIFKVISDIVPAPGDPALNKDTVITDTLSDYFTFATDKAAESVTVYAEYADGTVKQSEDATKAARDGVVVNGKTVTVTGYDFSAHHTTSSDPEKLVIEIKVKPSGDGCREEEIPTNNDVAGTHAARVEVEVESEGGTGTETKVVTSHETAKVTGHKVIYDLNGGTGNIKGNDLYYPQDADVPVTDSEPTLEGYEFTGWKSDIEGDNNVYTSDGANSSFTMPAANVTLMAQWTPNSGTKYTVRHHQQNLDNDNYTLYETESDKTGTTGELTNATAKNYKGFTAKSFEQKTIAANGSTVVDIYYDRNTYSVTYTDGVNDETIFADEVHQSVKYGAPVPAYNNGTNPSRKNYTFAGWDPSVPVTMPADNLMFAAKWEKNPVGDATFDFNDVFHDGKNTPAITKTVKGNVGKNFTETFAVTVKGADEKSTATMSAATMSAATSYTGKAEVTYSNRKDIAFQFNENDKLTFRNEGKYTYTVWEIPGGTSRMSYDTTVYTLTINVELDEDSNTYQVESWQFTAGNSKYPTPLNIVNTYRTYHPSTPSKPTLNTGDHYAYVMGYPDGTVRPNGSITRAEVSTILFRLLSDKTRDEYFTTESSFTDVKAGAWYNNSIATLEKAGVIVDTAKGGAFRPNEAITRAELAAMLAQFSDAKPVKGVKFSDVSAEHWAYEAIAIAAKMGWIEGYPDGTFRPDATITRAEMMTLVNRALERVPSDEDHLLSKRVMLTFPDCKSGNWFYIAVQEATNSHTYERAATEKNGDEQWTALRANRDWTLLEK